MALEILELFVRSILVGLAASITVGPVAVLCIQRTLSRSRLSGIVSGLGVSCADTLMAIVAYFFFSMFHSHIESLNLLFRVVGGIFVVVMGVYIFVQNPAKQLRRSRRGQSSHWQEFASVFGLTLANFALVIPYLLAFFAVFQISGDEHSSLGELPRGVVVNIGFFLGSLGWWTLLATVINLFRGKFRPRHMLTINHVAGGLITSLGVYTILSLFINLSAIKEIF